MLPGETNGFNGAICATCGATLQLDVQSSAAGWYLGYRCGIHGPVSRETGYYRYYESAQRALMEVLQTGTTELAR